MRRLHGTPSPSADRARPAARRSTDEQLLALPRYQDSELFTDLEKLVLAYAVGISRTPVEVSDALFARLREHFDEAQLVELTYVVARELPPALQPRVRDRLGGLQRRDGMRRPNPITGEQT